MLWFSDAAGAESILEDFLRLGKIESRISGADFNNQYPGSNPDRIHCRHCKQS